MNTEEIILDMSMTLQWSKTTKRTIEVSLESYAKYHNMTLQELLDEADEEEEQRIRIKNRSIKKRLLNYQQAMKQKHAPSTINRRMGHIRQFYSFYDIELPKTTNIRTVTTETIEDIPTREHIRQAIVSTPNKKGRAIIALMASSGLGRAEVYNLTIQNFIEATKEYTTHEDLLLILNDLKHKDTIPVFHVHRIKTKQPYYTFCTPEATNLIIEYLQERYFREEIKPNSKLFNLSSRGYISLFERINEKQGWGCKNNHKFFRTHSMRKYFATTLTKAKMDFMAVEFLLGHTINKTTAAYYKVDPVSLKKRYMELIHELTFLGEIKYDPIYPDEKKELEILRSKTKEQEQRISVIEELLRQRHI